MSDHESNIKTIEKIINEIGENAFNSALRELNIRMDKIKRENCTHDWQLSQIVGDGYTCYKCRSWKPED